MNRGLRTALCHVDELSDGASRGFDPLKGGRDTVFVVRKDEALHAWQDACPHHGTPMAWRRHAYLNAAGTRIVCNAHGAQFHIVTGECLLGPCLGQSLTAVAVGIDDAGIVYLTSEPTREMNP